jgi:hypothetical protein
LQLAFTDFQTGRHWFKQRFSLRERKFFAAENSIRFPPFSRLQRRADGIGLTVDTDTFSLNLGLDYGKGAFWHGADGVLVMEDSEGQQSSLTLPANPRLMAAGVDSITWPSDSPWVSATSETGIIPDTITLSVDPAQRRADTDEAVLIIVADKSAGSAPTNVRIVPIRLMCANGQVFLPAVRRNLSE